MILKLSTLLNLKKQKLLLLSYCFQLIRFIGSFYFFAITSHGLQCKIVIEKASILKRVLAHPNLSRDFRQAILKEGRSRNIILRNFFFFSRHWGRQNVSELNHPEAIVEVNKCRHVQVSEMTFIPLLREIYKPLRFNFALFYGRRN